MRNSELNRIYVSLDGATSPEMIFGTIEGSTEVQFGAAKKIYLRLTKAVHPDLFHDKADMEKAALAFKKLTSLWEQAQLRIKNGIYGNVSSTLPFQSFEIHSSKRKYQIEQLWKSGDISNVYSASAQLQDITRQVVIKIPRNPEDNDLASNEVHILRHLQSAPEYEKFRYFVSSLLDHFQFEEQLTGIVRQVAILSKLEGFYTLQEIHNAYPQGIDVKDMAWMWRRILTALEFAHSTHVIHGAVLPDHLLIHPEQHGVALIDWSYALLHAEKTNEHIHAISTKYKSWYPAEVFAKNVATKGLDIAMAAICMIHVLGGSHDPYSMPSTIPWQIQHHMKGCISPKVEQRPQHAHKLLEAFDCIIEQLWGPKTFHRFSMPTR